MLGLLAAVYSIYLLYTGLPVLMPCRAAVHCLAAPTPLPSP